MTPTPTPLLIGERRRKDTGGAGRGQGAEIEGASQGAKIGDDDHDLRSGDTRPETGTGLGGPGLETEDPGLETGGPGLEIEGPDRDLCLPPDLEMKDPGRTR